jgi:hypothetical protein
MADQLDPGDKLACGMGFKKGLPSFSSIDWHVSITVTKREGETDEEFSLRGWAAAEAELKRQVEAQDDILEVIRPVVGDPNEWD